MQQKATNHSGWQKSKNFESAKRASVHSHHIDLPCGSPHNTSVPIGPVKYAQKRNLSVCSEWLLRTTTSSQRSEWSRVSISVERNNEFSARWYEWTDSEDSPQSRSRSRHADLEHRADLDWLWWFRFKWNYEIIIEQNYPTADFTWPTDFVRSPWTLAGRHPNRST